MFRSGAKDSDGLDLLGVLWLSYPDRAYNFCSEDDGRLCAEIVELAPPPERRRVVSTEKVYLPCVAPDGTLLTGMLEYLAWTVAQIPPELLKTPSYAPLTPEQEQARPLMREFLERRRARAC